VIAFFDLDKTVLSVNSGVLWVRREAALGNLSKRQAVRAMVWLARYQLGFASAEQMVGEAVAQLVGTPAADLRQRTERFFLEEVQHTVRPGALEAIAAHRAANDALVLLTSSTDSLAGLAARQLGFEAILCNRLAVGPDGLHTGKVEGRICFGEGKLAHARAEAERRQVDLRRCVFYTDSYSDVSVMEQVGTPVAVNPDPRLRRRAQRAGWRVVDWGVPLRRAA
jgi:HAD superfamily hydrolase (TIGR01490 family)